MSKLFLFIGILTIASCGTKESTLAMMPLDAASELGGTACGDSAFFTACVHACGESDDSEPTPAACVGGHFHCVEPLVPASDCPAGSWTSTRLPCGPWPGTYNCGAGCAVCDVTQVWTCGRCSDAAS